MLYDTLTFTELSSQSLSEHRSKQLSVITEDNRQLPRQCSCGQISTGLHSDITVKFRTVSSSTLVHTLSPKQFSLRDGNACRPWIPDKAAMLQ